MSEFSRWASGYTGADRAEWPLWVLGAKLVRASFRENVGPGVDDLAGCDSLKYALHRYPELVVATDATMVLSLFTKFPRPLLDRSLLRSLLSELSFDEEDATNLHDSLFSDPIPDFPSAPGGDRMAWTRVAAVILRGPDPVFQSATHFMSTVDAICAKYGASVAPDGSPKFYLKHFSQYRCNAPRRIAHLLSLVRKKANFGQNLRTLVFNAHFFLDKSMANTLVADPAASTEATERAMCTFLDVSTKFLAGKSSLGAFEAALAPLMEQFASCFSEIHPDEGIPGDSTEWCLRSSFGFRQDGSLGGCVATGPVIDQKMALFFDGGRPGKTMCTAGLFALYCDPKERPAGHGALFACKNVGCVWEPVHVRSGRRAEPRWWTERRAN